jgi:hypothetical protein
MALTKYFRLANYSWMWSEGYYLHRLLTHTFEEQHMLGRWGIQEHHAFEGSSLLSEQCSPYAA